LPCGGTGNPAPLAGVVRVFPPIFTYKYRGGSSKEKRRGEERRDKKESRTEEKRRKQKKREEKNRGKQREKEKQNRGEEGEESPRTTSAAACRLQQRSQRLQPPQVSLSPLLFFFLSSASSRPQLSTIHIVYEQLRALFMAGLILAQPNI